MKNLLIFLNALLICRPSGMLTNRRGLKGRDHLAGIIIEKNVDCKDRQT